MDKTYKNIWLDAPDLHKWRTLEQTGLLIYFFLTFALLYCILYTVYILLNY
ncbi:hypothetical protein C1646_817206 [Rhizophagus diaphanus]|nr:hypothetical protein C1646_817206 [Rhizophagus diaphanus] [Rhizophagus sp. MUCL 43196]